MRYYRNWIGIQDKPSRQLVLNGFPDSGPRKKEMFTTENLTVCHGQAQTALLPCNFLEIRVFSRDNWWHHNWCRILYFNPWPKAFVVPVVRSLQPSLFFGRLELQPCLLVDQVWHSKRKCPRHLFGPHKKAITLVPPVRSHESGGSSRSTVSNGLRSLHWHLPEKWKVPEKNHGPLQPFSTFFVLAEFCSNLLAKKKNTYSPTL